MTTPLKISVSGVRGIVGESLTPEVAQNFARAFGTLVGPGPVVVGRDTRTHGPMLEAAVVAGLQLTGCKPLLAGVVPTPTLLIQAQALRARGGIAITASHNPAPWNGLKFVESTGLFLNAPRVEELVRLYRMQAFAQAPAARPETQAVSNPAREHFRRVLGYVDRAAIRKGKFRVAVDCCNGVGAVHSVPFLRDELGCKVFPVLDRPTGVFEREPEPLPENLTALREAVVRNGCDVGFAQDPDGDRLAIVDERGEAIGEDLTLALAMEQVLARHGRGTVVVTLSTSKSVDDVVAKHGCELVKTKIGEINVTETMLKLKAIGGGESNGGVIVPAVHPCRDSYLGMALVLELLAATGQKVSGLRAAIPRYHVVKDKLRASAEQASAILAALRKRYEGQKVNLLDGVHVDFGDRWIHVRASNTEPVVRITAEAPTESGAQRLAAELRVHVEAEM